MLRTDEKRCVKIADFQRQPAVTSLVDMLEAGMIDEEAAMQALRNVKG